MPEALALSAQIAAGEAIDVKDDAEGKAILKWADANSRIWIDDNPATISNGRLILKKREPDALALYGRATFAVRFGGTWPVLDLSDDVDEEKRKKVVPATPIQGRKILETTGGRIYFETDALKVSEKLTQSIQQQEPALAQLGFRHVGDLLCNLFPRIAVRGYAKDGGDTWATFLVAAPEILVFEMSTRFEKDNASLLTTRKPGGHDDAAKHTYQHPP